MELPRLVHRILGIQPRWNVGCPMSKEIIISKVKGSAGSFHPDEIAINDRQIQCSEQKCGPGIFPRSSIPNPDAQCMAYLPTFG